MPRVCLLFNDHSASTMSFRLHKRYVVQSSFEAVIWFCINSEVLQYYVAKFVG